MSFEPRLTVDITRHITRLLSRLWQQTVASKDIEVPTHGSSSAGLPSPPFDGWSHHSIAELHISPTPATFRGSSGFTPQLTMAKTFYETPNSTLVPSTIGTPAASPLLLSPPLSPVTSSPTIPQWTTQQNPTYTQPFNQPSWSFATTMPYPYTIFFWNRGPGRASVCVPANFDG